jgi:hypothetical protein
MIIECKSNSQLSLSEWYEMILDRMKIGMIFYTNTIITVIFRRRKFFLSRVSSITNMVKLMIKILN